MRRVFSAAGALTENFPDLCAVEQGLLSSSGQGGLCISDVMFAASARGDQARSSCADDVATETFLFVAYGWLLLQAGR
jgi:hypothetical protein